MLVISVELKKSLSERVVRTVVSAASYALQVIIVIGMFLVLGSEFFMSMTGGADPLQ